MKYSPYSQSLDHDLFQNKEPRPYAGLWKWLLAIGFCLFFVYRSTLPVTRLQSEPPPQFIDHTARGARGRVAPDARIARAYWKVAVQSIQPKYGREKSLPAAPPPEFRIDSKSSELSAGGDADRSFYWRRLRNLWNQPGIWKVSYGWNTEWLTNSLRTFPRYLSQSVDQLVQSVGFWKDELDKSGLL